MSSFDGDELRNFKMFLSPGEAEFQAYECVETGDQRMARAFYLDNSEVLHVYSPQALEAVEEGQSRSKNPDVIEYLQGDPADANYIDRVLDDENNLVGAEVIGYNELPDVIQEHV